MKLCLNIFATDESVTLVPAWRWRMMSLNAQKPKLYVNLEAEPKTGNIFPSF